MENKEIREKFKELVIRGFLFHKNGTYENEDQMMSSLFLQREIEDIMLSIDDVKINKGTFTEIPTNQYEKENFRKEVFIRLFSNACPAGNNSESERYMQESVEACYKAATMAADKMYPESEWKNLKYEKNGQQD